MAWDSKLPRPIVLKDGRKLVTLSDLRAVVVTFSGVIRDDALERGLELLLKAGESGKKKDIKAAADQLVIVLRMRQMQEVEEERSR